MRQRFALSGPLAFLLFSIFGPVAFGQSSPSAGSSAQAVALAGRALAALTGTTQIKDATLTGAATRTVGSDVETGSVSLKALGNPLSRLDFNGSAGMRSEIRNVSSGIAQGVWVTPDGTTHQMAEHNCVTDAAWFFPAFSVLSQLSNPNVIASYVGLETRAGVQVQHLQFLVQFPADTSGLFQKLSAEDIYLDASSYLPVAVAFNAHPDNDALTNIRIEIDFGSYQAVSGAQIPFQIRRLINGTPFLDITIQTAVLNSGLSQAIFAAQ